MLRKMIRKQNQILLVIAAVCLMVTLGCCLLTSFFERENEPGPVLVEELVGDCYFVSGEYGTLQELFEQSGDEIRLVYGRNQTGLYQGSDGDYYVGKEDKTVSMELPVYQKNGATLYFSDMILKNRFICTDFSVEKSDGVWITSGAVFSKENTRVFKKDVFLIDFFDGIYMNTMPFVIEDYISTGVAVNSVVKFYEDRIDVFEFFDGVLERRNIYVTGQTMIRVGTEKVSYFNLLKYLKDAYETEQPELQKNGILLEENYYYYFLGNRYEINGPSFLYETKDGLYLENEDKAFLLPDCPLYEEGTSRVFLPKDYMLLQMNQHTFYNIPAMGTVKLSEEAVYVAYQDVIASYREILLHDGQEHYLLLNDATLRLGTVELTVSPLSCIYISDTMELCFYQYDSEEFFSFATDGKEAELELANGDVIYLFDRIIRRKDGTLDLLQKDPSVFPVIQ